MLKNSTVLCFKHDIENKITFLQNTYRERITYQYFGIPQIGLSILFQLQVDNPDKRV